jgi:dTDP-4-amino-4,6-dideoxygalactose transaminase
MNIPTPVPTRSKENFLIFGSPAIEEAEIGEVVRTLRSGWIGCGPRVARFEEQFRNYKGCWRRAWGRATRSSPRR